jgi:hypothetical protein
MLSLRDRLAHAENILASPFCTTDTNKHLNQDGFSPSKVILCLKRPSIGMYGSSPSIGTDKSIGKLVTPFNNAGTPMGPFSGVQQAAFFTSAFHVRRSSPG